MAARPTPLQLALALSLIVNCGLAGFVLAGRLATPAPVSAGSVERTLDQYFLNLPQEVRASVLKRFTDAEPSYVPALQDLAAARRALAGALAREPYDREAAAAAFAALREANLAAQEPLHRLMVEAGTMLAPENRLELMHLRLGFSREWRENLRDVTNPGGGPGDDH